MNNRARGTKRERGGEKERKKESLRDIFFLLVHIPNACNTEGWAGPKLGAQNSVQVFIDDRNLSTQGPTYTNS